MKRVRVLHLLNELRPSGMERMLVSGRDAFTDLHVDISILGNGKQHPYAGALRASGYAVTTEAAPFHRLPLTVLRRHLRDTAPDVVHLHSESHYLESVLRLKLVAPSLPIVRTVHNVFPATGRWFISRTAQAALADRFVAALIAPSDDVAENERRLGRRADVVFNWVDDKFFALQASVSNRAGSIGAQPLKVAVVGNCSPIKNHEVVLRAAVDQGFRVDHVGNEDGASPTERALLAELSSLGLLSRRGPGDPETALAESDVFAMPSLHEGMGVALAEALVVGLPAVVASAPGLEWARRQPGVTTADPHDPQWGALLRRAAIGSQDARPSGFDFSASRGAAEYAAIYRRILERRGGR